MTNWSRPNRLTAYVFGNPGDQGQKTALAPFTILSLIPRTTAVQKFFAHGAKCLAGDHTLPLAAALRQIAVKLADFGDWDDDAKEKKLTSLPERLLQAGGRRRFDLLIEARLEVPPKDAGF